MTVRSHRPSIRVSDRRTIRTQGPETSAEQPLGERGVPAGSVLAPIRQTDLREAHRQLEHRHQLYVKLLQRVKRELDRGKAAKAKEEIRIFMTTPIPELPPLPDPETDLLPSDDEAFTDPAAETFIEGKLDDDL
jgi:hypothetical protein